MTRKKKHWLISDLVSRHVPDEGLDYQSQAAIDELKLGDMTQPDLFFVGNRSLVGIEIKLDAKADVEQIIKYATLFYFSKQNHKKICDCHLILIGKRTFPKFFKEKFGSIKELKSQFLIDRIPDVSWKGKINLKPHKERILNLAKAMSIEYHTYSDLNEILMAYEERIDKQNAYSQTLVKLFAGIKNELVTRKLAK